MQVMDVIKRRIQNFFLNDLNYLSAILKNKFNKINLTFLIDTAFLE